MAFISPKFGVGQTVYQHDSSVDAMFRGVIISIQATSHDATSYSGNWDLIYEVEFGGQQGIDWVPECELIEMANQWPEKGE